MKKKKRSADVTTEDENERDIPLVYAIQVSDKGKLQLGINSKKLLKPTRI